MGWVVMSERELRRIEVLSRVVQGRLSVTHAAEVLGVSPRQVQRLLRTFREDGAPALRHKARGRPSNNRIRAGCSLQPGNADQLCHATIYRFVYSKDRNIALSPLDTAHVVSVEPRSLSEGFL